MIRALLLLPLLLAACASGDDSLDFDTCGIRPRIQIPIERQGDLPLIRATVRGQPARFLLDTGASGVVLTETALNRLGLKSDARRIFTGIGAGGTIRNFAGKLTDLTILGTPAPLDIPDHPVQVLPETSGWAASGMADGLFGTSVLSVFEVDLDQPHDMVTLYYGRLCPSTVVPPWSTAYATLDASASVAGRFLVPVELEGRKLVALLDTGAEVSIVATDVAVALGISRAALAEGPSHEIVGTGPNRPIAYRHVFRELTFAGEVFKSPTLVVTERPEPAIDMVIGSDYLIGRRLWLSYARKRVFIERPAP